MQTRVGLVRDELDGVLQLCESLSHIAVLHQEHAQCVEHVGVIRGKLGCFLGIRQRLGITELSSRPGEIVEKGDVVRLQADQRLILPRRRLVIRFL